MATKTAHIHDLLQSIDSALKADHLGVYMAAFGCESPQNETYNYLCAVLANKIRPIHDELIACLAEHCREESKTKHFIHQCFTLPLSQESLQAIDDLARQNMGEDIKLPAIQQLSEKDAQKLLYAQYLGFINGVMGIPATSLDETQ